MFAKKEERKFFNEMQNLLDAASKSGFNEKEIREITVTRKGKIVYVWDFIEKVKLREREEKLSREESKIKERYLTVLDISEEIESRETKDLDLLKANSTFVGLEEK